jgi:hypothetical protein
VTVRPAKAKMEMEKMTRAIRISINVNPSDFFRKSITVVFDILNLLAFIVGKRDDPFNIQADFKKVNKEKALAHLHFSTTQ